MMPCANPCELRALKAQKYKAWGNAPGTQPPNYCRAVGAKVAVDVTLGNNANTAIIQTSITTVTDIPAVITPTATFIESRLRLGHPSKLVALGLHCFCAYSARCSWGDGTWGVAPGSKLLRFQRALVTGLPCIPLGRLGVSWEVLGLPWRYPLPWQEP